MAPIYSGRFTHESKGEAFAHTLFELFGLDNIEVEGLNDDEKKRFNELEIKTISDLNKVYTDNIKNNYFDGIDEEQIKKIIDDANEQAKDHASKLRDAIKQREIREIMQGCYKEVDFYQKYINKLLASANDKFINLVVYRDPLILDLNGNGKIDVSAEGSGVYFDFNKDGIASSTGWLTGGADGDSLLVFDKNFDGIINDGTELFGDDFIKANGKNAKNGFDALASLDSDKDGIISAFDPMYHFLKVWRDTNGDGVSQADELFSLAQLGITGLATGCQDKNESLEGGNLLSQEGVYIKADGSFGVMGDVNFVQDFMQIRSSISA